MPDLNRFLPPGVRLHALWLTLLATLGHTGTASADAVRLDALRLPAGFRIEVLSDAVPNARQMALSPAGTLYVGSLRAGVVYAIGQALTAPQPAQVVLDGLTMPSGIAMQGGTLYVGAVNRVLTVADVDQAVAKLPKDARLHATELTRELPDKRHHGWKYLAFGPDQQLYVPVGAPCNICESDDPRFAALLRMNPNTGATTIYAHGIRNTVGFDWHPSSAELWFTDNGRDLLGDDIPAEELNVVREAGAHYGYPYVHAGTLRDPKLGKDSDPAQFEPPALTLAAHSAALGVAFYAHEQFPSGYRNALFIAEHGSWNRSSKVGYRVSVVLETAAGLQYQPFIEGWLEEQSNWGRPNDVLVTPDGSLLISDDQLGAIYRVRYVGTEPPRPTPPQPAGQPKPPKTD